MKRVVVNVNGLVHPTVSKLITVYGGGLSQKQLMKAGTSHGGHPGLRTIQNLVKSDALNTMWKQILDRPEQDNVILDIGSKMASDYSIAIQMTRIRFDDVFPYDKLLKNKF